MHVVEQVLAHHGKTHICTHKPDNHLGITKYRLLSEEQKFWRLCRKHCCLDSHGGSDQVPPSNPGAIVAIKFFFFTEGSC